MDVLRWTGGVLLLTLQMYHVAAYPQGAPPGACSDMTPQHGYSPRTGAAPYDIGISAWAYCPKNEVNITLVGAPFGMVFRGFLCQARTSVSSDTTSGSLMVSTDSTVPTKNLCAGKASVTHADRSNKTSVQLTWTPDSTKTDSINIVCTIVEQKSTYWVKENIAIRYAGTDKCTPEGDVRGLPTSCTNSQTCEQAVTMAICDTTADADGECVCPSDMRIAHPTHTYCSPKVLGDACTSNSDCGAVAEAECDTTVTPRVCACKSAFTHNTTNTCYLKVLGDACSANNDCRGIPKSVCTSGTCKCPPEYKHQNNQTHTNCVMRALNDACDNDAQCTGITDAKCTGGMCKVEGMNVCTKAEDCTGTDGNQCVDGKCTSGATKEAVVSLMLMLASFVFIHLISIY